MRASDLFLAAELSPEEIAGFLRGFGFRDPSQADRHLQQISELAQEPEKLAELAPLLLEELSRSVHPDAALLHLHAFLEVAASPANLLSFLHDNPAALELLVQTLGASPYLTQLLIRNPEYFYWLLTGDRLQQVEDADYFQRQAREITRPLPDLAKKLDALRRLRRRESLRIGVQDLLQRTDCLATVSQVSLLAEAVLEATFELVSQELLGRRPAFSVLALGKLGGRELNFSSDVDLLYIYADEEDRPAIWKFAREFTRSLTEFTSQGRLYRVDLRLRPMGRGGEIAYSEKACQNYYQTWADTYDRLALIKVRPVAGDLELGHRFVESIQDFVYKKYLDLAAVEEIRWIKKRTDAEMRRRQQSHSNVKLGLGGIREIEFFVQAFQILYGGAHPELRTPNTLQALDRLVDLGLVGWSEQQRLRQAYLFLRNLEHKLQLVHDLQTHSLPEEERERRLCARRMGYRDRPGEDALEQFNRQLEEHHRQVRQIFDSLFESGTPGGKLEDLVLNPATEPAEALARLKSQGLTQPEAFLEGLQMLQEAPAFPHSPSRLRNLLANLLPRFLEAQRLCPDPRRLFSRFDRLCEALGASRAVFYTELVENEEFARRLFTLLASGEFLSETLIRNPELLDSVAQSSTARPSARRLHLFLKGARDSREERDRLRRFKQREEFKTACRTLLHPTSVDPRYRLTRLAEICLQAACRSLLRREPWLRQERFVLLALGKLGGRELTYHSDLDLIFVYDDTHSGRSASHFEPLLKELRDYLQGYTEAGQAYQLDFRLRPEGRHGTMAVARTAFQEYLRERMEPWERLAYAKLRPVFDHGGRLPAGLLVAPRPFSPKETRKLHHVRLRKERELAQERLSGHYDFKVGKGALLDIQFVVQWHQVQHQLYEPNTLRALKKLETSRQLDPSLARRLRRALRFYFSLEGMQGLLDTSEPDRLSKTGGENEILARFLGWESGEALLERYRKSREEVRQIYNRFFSF